MNYITTCTDFINGKATRKQKAKLRNDIEFTNTYTGLMLKSINRFKWEGLPDTCNTRMLECALQLNGTALLAKVNGGFLTLIATPDGSLNVYGEPVGAYGYGLNGFNQHFNLYVEGSENNIVPALNAESGQIDAVLFKDNELYYPFANYLRIGAERLTDVQRSIDVLARMLKAPGIITAQQKDVQNIQQTLENIDINTPYILGLGGLPYDTLKVLDTGIKAENLKVLYDYLTDLKGQMDELISINSNPSAEKRERLLVDEVNANNDSTAYTIDARLKQRQKDAEIANKFFGLNIEVTLNEDYNEDVKNEEDFTNEEGRDNNEGDKPETY